MMVMVVPRTPAPAAMARTPAAMVVTPVMMVAPMVMMAPVHRGGGGLARNRFDRGRRKRCSLRGGRADDRPAEHHRRSDRCSLQGSAEVS